MANQDSKREAGTLDGTPDKRLFYSIINDYDVPTAICELVDNSIDLWMKAGRRNALRVDIEVDVERQLINISDTAGGVKESELRVLIAPGASANPLDGETIGVFGVGSKRAVVALAEHISIKTHHKSGATFQIDIDPEWIASESWEIPHYSVPPISAGRTEIALRSLRKPVSENLVSRLRQKLGEVYSWFLAIEHCEIFLNDRQIEAVEFDDWAYPPENPPHVLRLTVPFESNGNVAVEITAGLILDRDAIEENYGAYFYCNNRLITKEARDREVGYWVSTQAGVPHPDASLCRAIVRFNGPAKAMPWNSSKTKINYSHPIFQAIQEHLIKLMSHFSSLSRRLKDDWPNKVFAHTDGSPREVETDELGDVSRLHLPSLPAVRKKHIELLRTNNKKQLEDQPWTLGLIESVAAVELVEKQKLETKNRIALLLLDSTFEIALKEFVVHRSDLFPGVNLKSFFQTRNQGLDQIALKVGIGKKHVDRAKHYYFLRNSLVHERATVDVTDHDVTTYKKTVQKILNIFFDLKF